MWKLCLIKRPFEKIAPGTAATTDSLSDRVPLARGYLDAKGFGNPAARLVPVFRIHCYCYFSSFFRLRPDSRFHPPPPPSPTLLLSKQPPSPFRERCRRAGDALVSVFRWRSPPFFPAREPRVPPRRTHIIITFKSLVRGPRHVSRLTRPIFSAPCATTSRRCGGDAVRSGSKTIKTLGRNSDFFPP